MNERRPLCVDLDGTLTTTDTLWELILSAVKVKPYLVGALPLWLMKGRAYLKQQAAHYGHFDAALVPYRTDFVDFLKHEHSKGRKLVLVTAADQKIAQQVATHIGFFNEVLASDGTLNLSGSHKAEVLTQKYGEKQFDYAGNSPIDRAVWKHADEAIVTGFAARSVSSLKKISNVTHAFPNRQSQFKAFLLSLRPHQWIKNLLVFVPLLLAHRVMDVSAWGNALIAFASLSLTASSLYLLNDLLDLPSDRRHPRKRYRPLAVGNLSPLIALVAIPVLLIISFGLAFILPPRFVAAIILYAIGSTFYSFYFKRLMIVDVLSIAALFSLRIIMGGFATQTPLSSWFLAFSAFIFLSGALVKRFAELKDMPDDAEHKAHGRGYTKQNLSFVGGLGLTSAYLAVAVLGAYIFRSPQVYQLYERPYMLLLVCLLLIYGVSRVWRKAYKGDVHDDPLITVATDRVNYLIGIVVIVFIILAV